MSGETSSVEQWLGFYTSRPFWAGEALDASSPGVRRAFTELMSAISWSGCRDGVAVNVCKDGLILLRSEELEQRIAADKNQEGVVDDISSVLAYWNEYLNLANVFYLLLDCSLLELTNFAYLELSEITNRDAFRCIYEDGKNVAQGIATASFASQFQMDRYAGENDPTTNHRILSRHVIEEGVFQHSFERFALLASDNIRIKRLSDLAKSLSEYKIGNFSIALVNAWFVCEQEIFDRWATYIDERATGYDDGRERINADRRKFLIGRDFTASVVSNILELLDIFSYDDLQKLDRVRRTRNAIAHSLDGNSCDDEICRVAIDIAARLVLENTTIGLKLNLGHSIEHM